MNCRATLSAHLPPRLPSWLHSPTSQGSGNCSVQPRASQNHSQQSRRLTASPPRPSGPESPPFAPLPASVSRARTSFFVVDLVLFCFVFFPLHSIPWETLRGYILPPRDTEGTGPEPAPGTLRTSASSLRPVVGGALALFIYLSRMAPHPPSCCSPLGKMKNGFRQWKTEACHMAPSV